MATATYRIGPSDFFTPGDLAADAKTLDDQVAALDSAIDGDEAPPDSWFDSWNLWRTRWRGFYTSHFEGFGSSFLTALNDSNRDELVRHEAEFVNWADQAKGYGIGLAGTVVEPSSGSGDSLGKQIGAFASSIGLSVPTFVIVVVLVIAALVTWRHA